MNIGKLLNVLQIIAASFYIIGCVGSYATNQPIAWWTAAIWAGIVLVYNVFGIEGLIEP